MIAAGAIGMFVFPIVAGIIEGVEYSGSSTGVDALWGIMPEVMVLSIMVALVVMVLRMS